MAFPVLLVSGGGFQGLAALKALRRSASVRVLVADCHEDNVTRSFADSYFRVPRVAEGAAFLDAVLAICRREHVRLVLPCTGYEQPALAAARDGFAAQGAAVAVSDSAFLEVARDKARLLEFFSEHAIPALERLAAEPGGRYPRIGKPLGGWGSRDLRVIRDPEEWRRQACPALTEDYLWQPYLEGCREFSVDFALGFDGAASELGARERVRVSGGVAVVSRASPDARVMALAGRVVDAVRARGGRGLFNLQLLADASGLFASDLNARIGTSAVHWSGAGPHPALFLCRSLDPSLADEEPRRPARMVRYLEELWLEQQPRPSGIRGVVFDLDDTLIHHKLWMAGKLERLIAELARALLDPEALRAEALRLTEEGPRGRLLDELAARFGIAAEAVPGLIERYRQIVPEGDVVFREAKEVLARLRAAGLRLGVLSDNPPASQRQKLAATGLAEMFDAVVLTQEAGAEKPDRRGFERVAEALGQPSAALAMVGDNPYRDGAGALAAGFGAAYLVQRAGTFFSFEPRVFGALGLRLRRIGDLRELLLDLTG